MKNLLIFGVIALGSCFSCKIYARETKHLSDSCILRGFTTQAINPKTLVDMKKDWHANSVRLMLRPNFNARQKRLATYKEGWNDIIKDLPAFLDQAKALNIAVILDLHNVPNDNAKHYRKERKEKSADFWNDETNLEIMKACWVELSYMCKGRDQIIWFDILNEPLDWRDFPNYTRKWPGWAQEVIDVIRPIEPTRPIVVEVGPGGLCWGFKDFPLLADKNIIYSSHQYQPHKYSHQGISSLNNTDLAKAYLETEQPWPGVYSDTGGGLWDKERLVKEMQPMIDFQKKYGVRIYISEFGVVRWAPDAAQYIEDNIEVFEEYGWDWSFHAFRENPIWSPEYEPVFKDNIKSSNTTEIAKVLLKYFHKEQ